MNATNQTTAQQVSDRLDNDGQQWADINDVEIHEMCEMQQGVLSKTDDLARYVFADDSSIVITDGGWDLGLAPDCYCWAGNHHHNADCGNS